jgi:uncharacterized protein YdeI (YjbR/CyaY-like superfamily)
MKRFESVDEYVAAGGTWKESLLLLREILSSTEMEEKVKWGIKPDRNKVLEIPREMLKAFSQNPALKDSFDALFLSKRRDYAEHVASAKREETRQKRLEKVLPVILEGMGLNDKYRN